MEKIKEVANEKLNSFIMDHMADYFKFVRRRLEIEVLNLEPEFSTLSCSEESNTS